MSNSLIYKEILVYDYYPASESTDDNTDEELFDHTSIFNSNYETTCETNFSNNENAYLNSLSSVDSANFSNISLSNNDNHSNNLSTQLLNKKRARTPAISFRNKKVHSKKTTSSNNFYSNKLINNKPSSNNFYNDNSTNNKHNNNKKTFSKTSKSNN